LINCVISSKNLHELEEMVGLAKSLGVWISFEPINESPGVSEKTWDELGIRKEVELQYVRSLDRLMDLKKNGAPIINSQTYLEMIRSRKLNFRCHASDIVLHVSADGTVENCRVVKDPLGNVSSGIRKVWDSSKEKRKQISKSCGGCLFFGYVENSLLYDFVPEVMAHYEWM
jgi:MoaA/NifB/PqqE/SkfB family radical SAM enzyme